MIIEIPKWLQRKLGMVSDTIPSDPPMKWDIDAKGLNQRKALSEEEHNSRLRKQIELAKQIMQLRDEEAKQRERTI